MKQFEEFTLNERLSLVSSYGQWIMSIKFYDFKRTLFNLYNVLIEVWYNEHTGYIEKIDSIKDIKDNRLDAYLREINLNID